MKKYFLTRESVCYLSKIDEKRLEHLLKENGWTPSDTLKGVDVVIVNTCVFARNFEDGCINLIERIKKEKDEKTKLVVGGCLPAVNKRRMLAHFKGPYFTPLTLSSISKILKTKHGNIDEIPTSQPILSDHNTPSGKGEKAFCIRVGYGCLNHCSYCAVKKVFPKLMSKSKEQLIKEFKSGLKLGYRKFFLTGEDTSVYGLDRRTNLTELLKDLIKIKTRKKISISLYRLNPQWLMKMDSDFMDVLKSKKINYISISVNSGSNRIIKLMNRKCDLEKFKNFLKKIKRMYPFIAISLDFMVGFPGETERDFQATLRFVRETKPDRIRIFRFSHRPGTKAKYLGKKISPKVKRKRMKRLFYLMSGNYGDSFIHTQSETQQLL